MLLVLDLAFRNVGVVVMDKGKIHKFGVISTKIKKRKQDRVSDIFAQECTQLADTLDKVIQKYSIKGILVELPNGSQNAIAARLLGGAVGILAAVATCRNLPVEYISEGDSKHAAFGKRKAKKDEAIAWAHKKYPDTDFKLSAAKMEHVADALMAYNGLRNSVLVRTFS